MSHFAQMAVEIKDKAALIEALVSCGIPREDIEVYEKAEALIDYHGKKTRYGIKDNPKDTRFSDCDKAHVIVRRDTLGGSHNDLGFYLDKEKSVAFICDFTRSAGSQVFKDETGKRISTDAWLKAVKQNYGLNVAKKHYAAQGKKVHMEKDVETGKMHLYVRA